jgi:selenocysteine lyase/cysteine desulfurase
MNSAKGLITHSTPLPEVLPPSIEAHVYVWTNSTDQLEPEIWSYDVFINQRLSRWVGQDEEYEEVDRRRAMNGDIVRTPPEAIQFGHALLKEFMFAPGYINLNNGSFGSTPKRVMRSVQAWELECEALPDEWNRKTYRPILVSVRERVAKLIGAETDECVIISNTTHGINEVLHNFSWQSGDVLIGFSTTYGAISKTLQYISDVPPHPTVSTINLTFPTTHDAIVDLFRAHVKAIPRTPGQQIVAVIDGIISMPGVILPWERMTAICKEEGIWSVIDAAHVIGQLPVNLEESQPDFWISNCHKWLSTKRGSAVLYVPKRNQNKIRTSFPTSHGYIPLGKPRAPNFVEQHEFNGTQDFSSYLSIGPALDFRESLGGEKRITEYCHNLAMEGGKRLAEILGTKVMDETGELTANMTNVLLPYSWIASASPEENTKLIDNIYERLYARNCFVGLFVHENKWWTRVSAQIWNEISDFEFVGKVLLEIGEQLQAEKAFERMQLPN